MITIVIKLHLKKINISKCFSEKLTYIISYVYYSYSSK